MSELSEILSKIGIYLSFDNPITLITGFILPIILMAIALNGILKRFMPFSNMVNGGISAIIAIMTVTTMPGFASVIGIVSVFIIGFSISWNLKSMIIGIILAALYFILVPIAVGYLEELLIF